MILLSAIQMNQSADNFSGFGQAQQAHAEGDDGDGKG
jgi:hypothetical protein